MKITLSPEAVAKLQPYLNDETALLLDLDDGVGKFSKFGICSLDISFRILVVDKTQDLKDYGTQLDSEVGPIGIKGYSADYIGESPSLTVNPRYQNLVLNSVSGLVDGNVGIVDFRGRE
ncbi:iron-sulfur cluster biosynthesis family protein [Enterococcus timonensis]|uniref:iron-sulfur cluster biosynthesis family protein n=1 Tax=Enterococcus timonensis TaxID=1852364 RepID=UPI0008D9ED9E|nr:iron-sulfur cluster biosynthesis family protein [Enterococcus timonensis]